MKNAPLRGAPSPRSALPARPASRPFRFAHRHPGPNRSRPGTPQRPNANAPPPGAACAELADHGTWNTTRYAHNQPQGRASSALVLPTHTVYRTMPRRSADFVV
eukprot:5670858-Prymnesium_polylepis.2